MMRKGIRWSLLVSFLFCGITSAAFVFDTDDKLTTKEHDQLEQQLQEIHDEQGVAVVVVVIEALDGALLEDIAEQIIAAHPLLEEGTRSMLVALAEKDQEELLLVSSSLNKYIDSAVVDYLKVNFLKPIVREKDYFEGISDMNVLLMKFFDGSEIPQEYIINNAYNTSSLSIGGSFVLFLVGALLSFVIAPRVKKQLHDKVQLQRVIAGGFVFLWAGLANRRFGGYSRLYIGGPTALVRIIAYQLTRVNRKQRQSAGPAVDIVYADTSKMYSSKPPSLYRG